MNLKYYFNYKLQIYGLSFITYVFLVVTRKVVSFGAFLL